MDGIILFFNSAKTMRSSFRDITKKVVCVMFL
jgi:hypothetical protein